MKRPVLLVVLVLLLWSCGSSDDKSDSNPAEGSDSAGTEESSELQGKLLTVGDLPGGYVVGEADVSGNASQICEGKLAIDERFPPAEKAEVEFQKSGTQALSGNLVAEMLAEYSNDGDAEEAFNGAESAAQECATFEQTDEEDGTAIKGQITPIASFPRFGDETLALTATGEVTLQNNTVPLTLEVVFVREGETLIGVANGGVGGSPVDPQLTEQLTEAAYQKVF